MKNTNLLVNILIIIAILCGIMILACGCAGGGYHVKEYYPDGQLKKRVDIDYLKPLIDYQYKGTKLITDEAVIVLGESHNRPDPNAIEAAGTAVGNVVGAASGNPLSVLPKKKTGSPFGNSPEIVQFEKEVFRNAFELPTETGEQK